MTSHPSPSAPEGPSAPPPAAAPLDVPEPSGTTLGAKCPVAATKTAGRYFCTRAAGHDGPCAATPFDNPEPEPSEAAYQEARDTQSDRLNDGGLCTGDEDCRPCRACVEALLEGAYRVDVAPLVARLREMEAVQARGLGEAIRQVTARAQSKWADDNEPAAVECENIVLLLQRIAPERGERCDRAVDDVRSVLVQLVRDCGGKEDDARWASALLDKAIWAALSPHVGRDPNRRDGMSGMTPGDLDKLERGAEAVINANEALGRDAPQEYHDMLALCRALRAEREQAGRADAMLAWASALAALSWSEDGRCVAVFFVGDDADERTVIGKDPGDCLRQMCESQARAALAPVPEAPRDE